MASRKEARNALAEDLRALADDLKILLQDPKERKKKERRWGVLYGALSLGATLAGRRGAAKAWGILTGELPPTKAQTGSTTTAQARETAPAGR